MKRNFKKIAASALILVVIGTAVVCALIAGCKPAEAQYEIEAYEKPTGLSEEQLSFEWKIRRSGYPSAIVFGDARETYGLDSLTFPAMLRSVQYENAGSSTGYVSVKDNLWEYWRDNGHNIAMFHTESFAVGTPTDYYSKIMNAGGTYLNGNGEAQSEQLGVSLLRAFAYEYVSEFSDEVSKYEKAQTDDERAIPDIRFVGSGVGAIYAMYAVDYIYGAYSQGKISEYVLPSRLAIINPWFTDAKVLSEAADVAERLARFGVAIEYVESDFEADALFTDAQKAAHKRITDQSAYLRMRESYSGGLSEEVRERIGITWYLASVNGSDYFRLSNEPSTERNRNPVYNMPDLYYNTYNNFAVSAWTPTPYVRLLRGVSFTPKAYNYDKNTAEDYTADKFRIELYQYSDKAGLRVGGYAFCDKNGDAVFNDGRMSGVLKNATVELVYKDSSSSSADEVVLARTKTDERGFYLFEVGAETYNSRNRTFYVRFQRPHYRYAYNKFSGAINEDLAMWYSTADDELTTVGSYYSDINRYCRTNRLINCGLEPTGGKGGK